MALTKFFVGPTFEKPPIYLILTFLRSKHFSILISSSALAKYIQCFISLFGWIKLGRDYAAQIFKALYFLCLVLI